MTPEAFAQLHARSIRVPRPWSAVEFADLLASPYCFAKGDETGFSLGRVIADEAELLTLVVDPARRRAGHGRRLLTAFEETARMRGACSAFLEVAIDNTPALALYTQQGYAEAARRPDYYAGIEGRQIDALVMRRTL